MWERMMSNREAYVEMLTMAEISFETFWDDDEVTIEVKSNGVIVAHTFDSAGNLVYIVAYA
jgi:hypothetical protein